MRERATWRWLAAVMLLALGLLLAASFPSDALARWLDHPAHPFRSDATDLSRPLRGAAWFRMAAIATAVGWMAGAVVLARLRSDEGRTADPPLGGRPAMLLALTVMLALAVRLPFLVHSLWFDEIAAIGDFTRFGPGPIVGSWFTPSNHVLQSLLTWASATAFGTSEATLRLPSLLAGLATVIVVHATARRALGEREALLAALVMALMPIAVLESTEARGYALMMCFGAVAAWAFVRGMQHGEPWTWLLLAAASALAVWSHLVAVALVVGIGIVALVDALGARGDPARRRRGISAIVGCALAALLSCTLLAPLMPDVLETRSQFRAGAADTPTLRSAEGLRVLLTLTGTWAAAIPPLAAAAPAAAIVVIGLAAGTRRRLPRLALAASLAGLPVLLAIVVLGGSWTYARFASFAAPGTAIALAIGIAAALRARRALGIALAAMLAASFIMELALLPPRQPYMDAVSELQARAAPGDLAIDASIRGAPSAFYATPAVPIVGSGVMAEHLAQRLADRRVRFAVVSYAHALPAERFEALHANGFAVVREWPGWIDWGGGSVQLWQRGATPRP